MDKYSDTINPKNNRINLFDIEKKNVENLRGKKKQLQKFIYNKECLEDQNYIEKWNINW